MEYSNRQHMELKSSEGPMPDDEYLILHLLGHTGRDTTARGMMHEGLVQSVGLRAVFEAYAGAGHNFSNLLGAILARVSLIRKESNDTEMVANQTRAIESIVKDAVAIARRLQTLTEESDSEWDVLDIYELVLEAVDMTRPRWQDAPINEAGQLS